MDVTADSVPSQTPPPPRRRGHGGAVGWPPTTVADEGTDRAQLGWAEIQPRTPVRAAQPGTWSVIYHVGARGVDDGGSVRFAWRDTSDWAAPQFDDPAAANYAVVRIDGAASFRVGFEKQRYPRPFRTGVVVDIFDGWLQQDDSVTLILGARDGGGPGSYAQTFADPHFEFRVAVDWAGAAIPVAVPSPTVRVVADAPQRIVAVGPSAPDHRGRGWLGVRIEDEWGNVCDAFRGSVTFDSGGLAGMPASYRFTERDAGAHRFIDLVAPCASSYRVRATAPGLLPAEANPFVVAETASPATPLWGDLHGQSGETVGAGSVEAYFAFARHRAFLDFAGHQSNDLQITPALWERIRQAANDHDTPGHFAALLGWEWSGNTAVGGDHNVYLPAQDGPLYRSSTLLAAPADDEHPHIEALYSRLREAEPGALVVPHVGGRRANLDWHSPELESVIEVLSEWGEFEWFLRDALARGYRVGFVCGSDDHKGRPGAGHPGRSTFGVYGGLTCVLGESLGRAAVLDALRQRRCYGTSGPRIAVSAECGGHPMGAAFTASSPPPVEVAVAGTDDVESIALLRGSEEVAVHPDQPARSADTVRVAWRGARNRDRQRPLRWDGALEISGGVFDDARGWAFDPRPRGCTKQRRAAWPGGR